MSRLVIHRRASLLVAVADSLARSGGVDPIAHARGFADGWSRASQAALNRLSIIAGMRPDPVAQKRFVEELAERAETKCLNCALPALPDRDRCESCDHEHRDQLATESALEAP